MSQHDQAQRKRRRRRSKKKLSLRQDGNDINSSSGDSISYNSDSSSESDDSSVESNENNGSQDYRTQIMKMDIADDMQVALLSAMAHSSSPMAENISTGPAYDFANIQSKTEDSDMKEDDEEKDSSLIIENILNIDYSSSEDENEKSTGTVENKKVVEESDDDESDIDLTESLKKMEDVGVEEEDDRKSRRKTSSKVESNNKSIKSENEVDGYAQFTSEEDIQLLSKMVNFQIKEEESQIINQILEKKDAISKRNISNVNVKKELAGMIQNHLVTERTIVVQSAVNAPPLDEGSLLVMKIPKNIDNHDSNHIIPLGKVFEAFGPVLRPFYTVRLPDPNISKSSHSESKSKHPTKTTQIPPDTSIASKLIDEKEKEGESKQTEGNDDSNKSFDNISTESENTESNKNMPAFENNMKVESIDKKKLSNEKEIPSLEGTPTNDQIKNEKSLNECASHAYVQDPWSINGIYTKFLKENESVSVFYIQSNNFPNSLTSVIDTRAVMRRSGKGCDASNVYDEELNANEVEYSDDEEERKAKAARKKKKQPKQNNIFKNGAFQGKGGRGRGRHQKNIYHSAPPSFQSPPNMQYQSNLNGQQQYNPYGNSYNSPPPNQYPQQPYAQFNPYGMHQQYNPHNQYPNYQHGNGTQGQSQEYYNPHTSSPFYPPPPPPPPPPPSSNRN